MKRVMLLASAGALLAACGMAGAEPVLTGPGGILDTLYGWGNLSEVPPALDQLWVNPTDEVAVEVQAKWAAYTQTFGYLPGSTGGTFQPLFVVCGNGYFGGKPSATIPKAVSGLIFRFADDPSGAPLWSSQATDNLDGRDHMRTFLITKGPSAGNFVIAWEDLPCLGDRDFQDLVVEVHGVTQVPEPSMLAVLTPAGAVIALARGRRR